MKQEYDMVMVMAPKVIKLQDYNPRAGNELRIQYNRCGVINSGAGV